MESDCNNRRSPDTESGASSGGGTWTMWYTWLLPQWAGIHLLNTYHLYLLWNLLSTCHLHAAPLISIVFLTRAVDIFSLEWRSMGFQQRKVKWLFLLPCAFKDAPALGTWILLLSLQSWALVWNWPAPVTLQSCLIISPFLPHTYHSACLRCQAP